MNTLMNAWINSWKECESQENDSTADIIDEEMNWEADKIMPKYSQSVFVWIQE